MTAKRKTKATNCSYPGARLISRRIWTPPHLVFFFFLRGGGATPSPLFNFFWAGILMGNGRWAKNLKIHVGRRDESICSTFASFFEESIIFIFRILLCRVFVEKMVEKPIKKISFKYFTILLVFFRIKQVCKGQFLDFSHIFLFLLISRWFLRYYFIVFNLFYNLKIFHTFFMPYFILFLYKKYI